MDLKQLAKDVSNELGIDPDVVCAIIEIESGWNPLAIRFEAKWRYLIDPDKYAKLHKITFDTEAALQSFSYGLMQLMGTVIRELGFIGPLQDGSVMDAERNIRFGIKKLKTLMDRYDQLNDIVASYNAGRPVILDSGLYQNQNYVDKFNRAYKNLKGMGVVNG